MSFHASAKDFICFYVLGVFVLVVVLYTNSTKKSIELIDTMQTVCYNWSIMNFKQIPCKMCGNIFSPSSPKNWFCGEQKDKSSCRYKNYLNIKHKNREKYKKTYVKNCKDCGVEFTTHKPEKIYCGSSTEKIGCSFLHRKGKIYNQDLSLPKKCLS